MDIRASYTDVRLSPRVQIQIVKAYMDKLQKEIEDQTQDHFRSGNELIEDIEDFVLDNNYKLFSPV